MSCRIYGIILSLFSGKTYCFSINMENNRRERSLGICQANGECLTRIMTSVDRIPGHDYQWKP